MIVLLTQKFRHPCKQESTSWYVRMVEVPREESLAGGEDVPLKIFLIYDARSLFSRFSLFCVSASFLHLSPPERGCSSALLGESYSRRVFFSTLYTQPTSLSLHRSQVIELERNTLSLHANTNTLSTTTWGFVNAQRQLCMSSSASSLLPSPFKAKKCCSGAVLATTMPRPHASNPAPWDTAAPAD